jgi:hypothetical protein
MVTEWWMHVNVYCFSGSVYYGCAMNFDVVIKKHWKTFTLVYLLLYDQTNVIHATSLHAHTAGKQLSHLKQNLCNQTKHKFLAALVETDN